MLKSLTLALLVASLLGPLRALPAESTNSYLIFSSRSNEVTELDEKLSQGLYDIVSANGFKVRDLGLGDAGNGITMSIEGSCSDLRQAIKRIQDKFGLALVSCAAQSP